MKIKFINELKDINYLYNLINKNLIKRNIYKKYELDDYEIHKTIVHYWERLIDNVTIFIHSFRSYINYKGNFKNYLNNINTYLNELKDKIYTKYY